MNIIRVFFIPEFVAENLRSYKNKRKISLILQYSFTQKTTLILRISTLLNLKIKCSQNTAKKKIWTSKVRQWTMTKFLIRSHFLSTIWKSNNKLSMRPFKKYVNCIMAFFTPFNFVTLCQFYCTTYPVSFTKLHQETIEWEGKRFFAYVAASAYHVISTEIENHIFRHDRIFRHICIYKQAILTK